MLLERELVVKIVFVFFVSQVCLHGLGVEDGNITNSQLSASSSVNSFTPDKARLNGDSCWMPSGAGTTTVTSGYTSSHILFVS